jgi:hypothetical protein
MAGLAVTDGVFGGQAVRWVAALRRLTRSRFCRERDAEWREWRSAVGHGSWSVVSPEWFHVKPLPAT